jgi:putative flippase GtrA
MTPPDHRRSVSPTTSAAVLAALAVLLDVVLVLIGIPAHQNELANFSQEIATGPPLAVLGFLIVRQQPGNKVGWLMLAAAVTLPLTSIGEPYAVMIYRLGYPLPFGLAAGLVAYSWPAPIAALAVAVLLFPDGRLPSPRWRWALRAVIAAVACVLGSNYAAVIGADAGHHIRFDSTGGIAAVDSPAGWLAIVNSVGTAVIVGCLLSFVAAQVLTWRRADGDRRQQLKWLLSGAVTFLVSGIVGLPVGTLDATPSSFVHGAVNAVSILGFVALPLGMGVAILKYRLYDIDRIISRTLAYAIVTGLLVGLYAGLVLLATRVLTFHTPVAVAAATLAAAALFSPLRRRVQQVVDRRFNRARYDADRTLAAFVARLHDVTDPDVVRSDLIATVQHALEPAHLSLSLTGGAR